MPKLLGDGKVMAGASGVLAMRNALAGEIKELDSTPRRGNVNQRWLEHMTFTCRVRLMPAPLYQ
jgi:hypothetical protein